MSRKQTRKTISFTMDELLHIWHRLNVPVNMSYESYAKRQDSKVTKVDDWFNQSVWSKINHRLGKYGDIVHTKPQPIKVAYNGECCEER